MHTVDPDDIEDILNQARLGSSGAFAKLYQLYVVPLYRYIYFRVSNKLDAEDLTQDVFLKAYASLPKYVSSGSSPLAFLYTIARNTIVDHYRKKKTVRADDSLFDNIEDSQDTAEVALAKKEEYENLRRYISTLPHDQREAVTMRFIDGLSTQEIATLLGKTEAAVRQLQSRGLRLLRTLLAPDLQQ